MTKATDKQLEYTIIIPFPRRQRLCERALVLRYSYTAFLVNCHKT